MCTRTPRECEANCCGYTPLSAEGVLPEQARLGIRKLLSCAPLHFYPNPLGKAAEAIRLLNQLRKSGESGPYAIAILFSLRISHYGETSLDKESVEPIEKQIQQLWAADIPEEGANSSASILMFEGAYEKAKGIVDRLSTTSTTVDSLKGWIYALRGKGDAKQALDLFDKAIEADQHSEAYLGKAKIFELRFFVIIRPSPPPGRSSLPIGATLEK